MLRDDACVFRQQHSLHHDSGHGSFWRAVSTILIAMPLKGITHTSTQLQLELLTFQQWEQVLRV
eukprot:3547012-Amphidinium_carterae.2